jgi:hypothetical protein
MDSHKIYLVNVGVHLKVDGDQHFRADRRRSRDLLRRAINEAAQDPRLAPVSRTRERVRSYEVTEEIGH